MTDDKCIFCSIVAGELKSEIVDSNDVVVVIKDIAPKAPIHYLIIPRIHLAHMGELSEENEAHKKALHAMGFMVSKLAKGLAAPVAFNVICNNGPEAGQAVHHLHWHFLAGKNIYSDKGLPEL